jgi:DNA-binding MarR family transcriptional regulator
MKQAAKETGPLYTPENYRMEDSVGRLIKEVSLRLQGAVDEEMAALGMDITGAQWAILLRVANGCSATAAQLCRSASYDTGSMTRMLDRLEEKGLIRRVRSSKDRRVISLELTEAGHQLVPQLAPVAIKVLNAHLKGFTRQELEQFKGFLIRMRANSGQSA